MLLRAIRTFDSGAVGFQYRGNVFDAPESLGRQMLSLGLAERVEVAEPVNKVVQAAPVAPDVAVIPAESAPDEPSSKPAPRARRARR